MRIFVAEAAIRFYHLVGLSVWEFDCRSPVAQLRCQLFFISAQYLGGSLCFYFKAGTCYRRRNSRR